MLIRFRLLRVSVPYRGIYISNSENSYSFGAFTQFPSPIGESIFQMIVSRHGVTTRKSVSVPYRGIYISNLYRIHKTYTVEFPSPIGESIFQILNEVMALGVDRGFRPLSGNLYFKLLKLFVTRMMIVSVPYRGIYISNSE